VYDFGELEGTPYMIVEYVPGGSLNDRMKSGGRFGREYSLRLLDGIGEALDHAHGLGIVHRDVKPANVLLDAGGNPILADFGLAKLLQHSSLKTATGVTTGTPAYMSPEQVMGAAVGPAADTYALATMAYELLAGALPFEAEGVLELLYAHVHRQPPPASSRNHELGPAVDAALARGLARDPAQRWESSAALVAALREALAASPAPAVATLPVPDRPRPEPASFPSPGRARGRGRLLPAAVAGVLLLALVLGVLALLNRQHRGAPHLTAAPASVREGGSVRLSGSGYRSGRAFVEAGSTLLASDLDTGGGSWSATVTVPATLAPGRYQLRACNGPAPGSDCATAALTVTR
jgi:serine/threonine protein kinase